MRVCPQCNTPYSDDASSCARDGLSLVTLNDTTKSSSATAPKVLIGAVIGNYRLHKLLGAGGMGAVYQATHISVGKEVAVKIIKEEDCKNPTLVERFFREARSIAKVNHENVLQLLDFGSTPDGQLYLVTELLVGKSLADLITEEPILSDKRAVHIATQIARGLEAAHQQKIIHRDLKPENIFLTSFRTDKDFAKILDFGIAKELEDLPPGSQGITAPGGFLGTPLYMAPEQGTEVDGRSDIYSLGLILYRMLTGQVPFVSSNLADLIYKHITEAPKPPRSLNPVISEALEKMVLRAIAKSKLDRYQTMSEFAEALESISPLSEEAPKSVVPVSEPPRLTLTTLSGSNGEQPNPGTKKRSPLWLAAAILCAGAAGAYFAVAPKETRAIEAAPLSEAKPTPESTPSAQAASEPIAPPANVIAPTTTAAIEPSKAPTEKTSSKKTKKNHKDKFSNTGDSGL